ncbi:MAG: (d)CMP kinase [Planctomycetota bacterium]|jgi:cytidylate kinase
MIITIDGPAGSGKSTAARQLAKALGTAYLDTGATYRAVTLKAMREGIDLADEGSLAELARRSDIRLTPEQAGTRVFMDGRDVSREIRSEKVSQKSYYVARSPTVREVLVALQRKLGAGLGDFIAEGRDQGSVVFPEAEFKFYLDASPEVRARRRTDEMLADGQDVRYEEVLAAILERNGRDRSRAVAPLVKPQGAIEIDTTDMTIDEVVAELHRHVKAKSRGEGGEAAP